MSRVISLEEAFRITYDKYKYSCPKCKLGTMCLNPFESGVGGYGPDDIKQYFVFNCDRCKHTERRTEDLEITNFKGEEINGCIEKK